MNGQIWLRWFFPKRQRAERQDEIHEALLGGAFCLLLAVIGGLTLYLFGEQLFAAGGYQSTLGMIAVGCAILGGYGFLLGLFQLAIAATIGWRWAFSGVVLLGGLIFIIKLATGQP